MKLVKSTKLCKILKEILSDMMRSIISKEVQASVRAIVREEVKAFVRQEVEGCVRPIIREEVDGIVREKVQSLFERIEGLVNDRFVTVLAPLVVDTHAMDPPTRDPTAMDPSVSNLLLNNPEAIVNDVVKLNTTL